MEPNYTPPGRFRGRTELSIVAIGRSSLSAADRAVMRQRPLERLPTPLRPQFLKHSDDQSLAALEAVAHAIDSLPPGKNFYDWAVVSASRYLGRESFAAAIDKYQTEGPWGVSVHIIPHSSPHAVAGTLSLALKCHGPSIGAAAAAEDELQAVLTLAAFLQRPAFGGAWFVTTGFTDSGQKCDGVALAILNASRNSVDDQALGRIRIGNVPAAEVAADESTCSQEPLAGFLGMERSGPACWQGTTGALRIAIELSRDRIDNRSLAA